jgi:hypothetical protein
MEITATIDYTKLPDRNGEPIACHHAWHYAADGLPFCHDGSQGRRCEGYTVQCGKGHAKCERHADRRADEPKPKSKSAPYHPMSSYTVTLTTNELTMITLALEERERVLIERAKVVADSSFHADAPMIAEASREYSDLRLKLRRLPANSPALDALLRAGEADRAPLFPNA